MSNHAARLTAFLFFFPGLASASPQAVAPLTHAVPAGVHFIATWRGTPERAAIDDLYLRAGKRLWDSGVAWDLFDLVSAKAPAEHRDRARAAVEKVLAALGKVDWGTAFGQEGAFAFRFGIPMPEYLLLGRCPEAGLEQSLQGLRGLLGEIASLAPDALEVREGSGGGSETTSLVAKGAPIGIQVARVKGTIVLGFGQSLFASTVHLLGAGDCQGSIGKAASYEKALSHLPRERDEEGYFDLAGMCGVFANGITAAGASAGPQAAPVLGAVSTLFEEVAAMQSIAWAARGAGSRLVYDEVVLFEPGSSNRFFPRLFGGSRTVEGLDRFLPKDTVTGCASAGCDLLGAYDALLEAVGNVEGSEKVLEAWRGVQAQFGFDLRADLLAWFSGEHVSVRVPSSRPGLFGDTTGVQLWKVKNPGEAAARVEGLLAKAAAHVRDRGQEMRIEPATGTEGLRTISIEAFPNFRPVVGVRGEWLVLAGSAEAAAKVLATREGKAPAIGESERWRALALGIDGPVGSIYYADVEGQLEGFAQLLSGAGFFLSMIPREKDTEPVLKVGAILTKLGRFFREVDVERDRGGFTRPLKGAEGIQVRTVSTFRRAG